MDHQAIINSTILFVRDTLKNAEGGHDWWHIHRVWTNTKHIAQTEAVDMLTVELAALLHDIADSKFHNGDEEIGPKTAGDYLTSIGIDPAVTLHIQNIIRYMSFKAGFDAPAFYSPELAVVQDADRLDAIGAIGIARAFSYGGHKGRELYNPGIKPDMNMSKEAYKNSTAPTINHFYEKLLLLKDKMNTETGKRLATQRHEFMEQFLQQLYAECDLNNI
ncbi:HD domain-containing protein [Mucilaginibacter ximonensis]|uniref:HD domain-containing protein n=1 Tax=Mucilaginibacter ximonensis TaxID=538021 RepID=A0ABW5YAR7_9SPHI